LDLDFEAILKSVFRRLAAPVEQTMEQTSTFKGGGGCYGGDFS